MFDLHIINHAPSTRPEWWERCLSSAREAEDKGLCSVHVVESQSTNIGARSAAGFAIGHHPYVAYLDNDDILLPEAIPAMLDVLDNNPELCGVYSDNQQIDADGAVMFERKRAAWSAVAQLCKADYPHHLAIYKRSAVMPFLPMIAEFSTYSMFVLAGLVTQFGSWEHVPVIAYQRREQPYYVNHVRPIDRETARRARDLVTPVLLKHCKK